MQIASPLHHLTLSVTDLDRSVEWYRRALGLEHAADREAPGWKRVLLRSRAGLVIGLTRHDTTPADDRFDHTRVGLDHLSIHCPDRGAVEAWARHLESAGIEHEGVVDAPTGHVLVCRDPDGIPVEFFATPTP